MEGKIIKSYNFTILKCINKHEKLQTSTPLVFSHHTRVLQYSPTSRLRLNFRPNNNKKKRAKHEPHFSHNLPEYETRRTSIFTINTGEQKKPLRKHRRTTLPQNWAEKSRVLGPRSVGRARREDTYRRRHGLEHPLGIELALSRARCTSVPVSLPPSLSVYAMSKGAAGELSR